MVDSGRDGRGKVPVPVEPVPNLSSSHLTRFLSPHTVHPIGHAGKGTGGNIWGKNHQLAICMLIPSISHLAQNLVIEIVLSPLES